MRLHVPSLLATAVVAAVAAGAGCGINVKPLEAYDVVISPTQDCTLTGSTSRSCVDDADLAAQKITGRWIIESGPAESFSLTTQEGLTLPGIYFGDDAAVLNQEPCTGTSEGAALCYFARRKFESTDARDNGCTKFGELVAILLRSSDASFSGIVSDTSGTDADCGTSTVVQVVENVTGTLTATPSLAREEAAKDEGVAP